MLLYSHEYLLMSSIPLLVNALPCLTKSTSEHCSLSKVTWVFPCGSAGKVSACNAGDLGLTPGLGRTPEERNSHPFQYSGLENSMDCIVHGVAKTWTRLSDFHFQGHMD